MRPRRGGLALAALLATAVLGVALLLGSRTVPEPGTTPVGEEQPVAPCAFHESALIPVADMKALGYANSSRCLVDSAGSAWIAVRSKQGGEFSICLVRADAPWGSGTRVTQTWLEDRDSLLISTEPQRAPAIAAGSDGSIHMVWYGADTSGRDHQVRYARFSTGSTPRIEEALTPFRVPGFEAVLASAAIPIELWQEHAAIAVGDDGTAHVAWEARDPFRRASDGTPRPGIAYATRSRDGTWSPAGVLDRPPYLEINERFSGQSRPSILIDRTGLVHVLCYGAVGGLQQVLHGTIAERGFSGWKPIAPSSGDQRHAAAALDVQGRLHVAWREGVAPADASPAAVAILYSVRDTDGRWHSPMRLTPAYENASTPSVGVTDSSVCVAWVAWRPGSANTEGRIDNGFPADNSTVEGRIEVTSSALGTARFDAPTVIDPGPASYPCWAVGPSNGAARPALVWTSVDTAADPARRVRLKLGWCGPAH